MNIIKKPIVSEKATSINELRNCVSFIVDSKANKIEIKKAVEASYNVTVKKVRTIVYAPVRKNKFTKTGLQKSKSISFKKAMVQLAEEDNIDFYSNI